MRVRQLLAVAFILAATGLGAFSTIILAGPAWGAAAVLWGFPAVAVGCMALVLVMEHPWWSGAEPEWVVNDNAELGVRVGGQFFWLYKGRSLVYPSGLHDDGTPMRWRPVEKREFGETCGPRDLKRLDGRYTLGAGWRNLG